MPKSVPQSDTVKFGKALYDFTPPPDGKSQKIAFKKADIIEITYSEKNEGWWWGRITKTVSGDPPPGVSGFFPAKYVRVIEEDFKLEDRVQIVGLKKFPKFNGQIGSIKDFKQGLWSVELPALDNCVVQVRSRNLKKLLGSLVSKKEPETEQEKESQEKESTEKIEAGKQQDKRLKDMDISGVSNATYAASLATSTVSSSSMPNLPETPSKKTQSKTNPSKATHSKKTSISKNSEERLMELENENRTLRLKLKQMAISKKSSNENNDAESKKKEIENGFGVSHGSGWDQSIVDELSKFLRRTSMRNESFRIIESSYNAKNKTFDIDTENKMVSALIPEDRKKCNISFNTDSLQLKPEELKDHHEKTLSNKSVSKLREWVAANRGHVSGCVKELWQNLMDKILQDEVEAMAELLKSDPIDDSKIAQIIYDCFEEPLKPLFDSDTERRLDVQSKFVQECLRKINTFTKEAEEERKKKNAKSFVAAKKKDGEAFEERRKLLKHVQRYKDIINESVEYTLPLDLKIRSQRCSEDIDQLSMKYIETRHLCEEDQVTINTMMLEVDEKEKVRVDVNKKRVATFESFLESDQEERKKHHEEMMRILAQERSRQVRFVDTCLAELLRRQEEGLRKKDVNQFTSQAKIHSNLIEKKIQYLTKAETFMESCKDLLSNFTSKALHIIKTQQQHIDGKKATLEELYAKEYEGLKCGIDVQESKIREGLTKLQIRIKNKEKELADAYAEEDADDVEECEAAIASYQKRQAKLAEELKSISMLKENIEKKDFT